MRVIFFVIGVGAIAYFQTKPMMKASSSKTAVRELTIYVAIMVVTGVLGVLLLLGVKPPSPILPFEMLFENIGRKLLGE